MLQLYTFLFSWSNLLLASFCPLYAFTTFIPEYIIAVNTEISTEDEFECHGEYFKYVDLGTEKALVLKHTGREK